MTAPYFNWQEVLSSDERPTLSWVDSRRRLRGLFALLLLALFVIVARLWSLEVTTGERTRREAGQALSREVTLPARRGRIVDRRGAILAEDRELQTLTLHYRHLEEPPHPAWLDYQARRRLSLSQRRDPRQMRAMLAQLRVERAEMHRRLAGFSGLSLDEWNAARARVQRQVERIADEVNARHRARQSEPTEEEPRDLRTWLVQKLLTPSETTTPRKIIIAEELDYHELVLDLPPAAVAAIEADPERFPGVTIATRRGRAYPQHALAAHLVGHVGPVPEDVLAASEGVYEAEDFVGRLGLERQYETALRGARGLAEQQVDRRGQTLNSRTVRPAVAGRDLVLTLDLAVQRSAERLLESALARRRDAPASAGGAVVVLDCQSGAVLVAASAPRFDPNTLLHGPSSEIARLLSAADKPLFDRVTKMALPPGSVMKALTSVALLEERTIDPRAAFYCQGYLQREDAQRCALFRQFGVGHEEVDLSRALAESCNVYFFHHAAQLGPQPLVDWAARFGLGRPTGVDLPHEAAGQLPSPESYQRANRPWRTADTQALAIGQSTLTTTPLQIARLMAALANGGRLVTPHVVQDAAAPPAHYVGAQAETLAEVRRGMQRAVNDASGTAHATLFYEPVSLAAKTGTAQTGGDRPDHAWIAGYAPADQPRFAFVVVLEHAGGGGEVAGPIAQGLIARMNELGYFAPGEVAARP